MDISQLTGGNAASDSAKSSSDVKIELMAERLSSQHSKKSNQLAASSQYNLAHQSTTSAAGIKLVTIPLQPSQNKS